MAAGDRIEIANQETSESILAQTDVKTSTRAAATELAAVKSTVGTINTNAAKLTDARMAKVDNLGATGDTGGSTTAGTIAAKLNTLIGWFAGTWTAARAAKIDTINTNAAKLTDARATKIDNIDAKVSTRASSAEVTAVGTKADAAGTKVDNLAATIGATNNTGGTATAGTIAAKLNTLIGWFTGTWTATRAQKIDTIATDVAAAKTNSSNANTNATNATTKAEAARVAAVAAQNNTATNNTVNSTGTLSQKLAWLISTWTAARAQKIDTIATDATAAKNNAANANTNAANAATKAEQARVAAVNAQNGMASFKYLKPSNNLRHTVYDGNFTTTTNTAWAKLGIFVPKYAGEFKVIIHFSNDGSTDSWTYVCGYTLKPGVRGYVPNETLGLIDVRAVWADDYYDFLGMATGTSVTSSAIYDEVYHVGKSTALFRTETHTSDRTTTIYVSVDTPNVPIIVFGQIPKGTKDQTRNWIKSIKVYYDEVSI